MQMHDPSVELTRLAPFLNRMGFDKNAALAYSIWCDALVFSDEVPNEPIGDDALLRYLLRYRTSVILGREEKKLKELWDAAKQAFPDWPGFAEGRCESSVTLAQKYAELKRQEE